jgi:Glutaredoxin-like domain (DUF836)
MGMEKSALHERLRCREAGNDTSTKIILPSIDKFSSITTMKPTSSLLRSLANLTLFTRTNCSLCETAKLSLAEIRKRGDRTYNEINVMDQKHEKWKSIYELDVPVVCVISIYAL